MSSRLSPKRLALVMMLVAGPAVGCDGGCSCDEGPSEDLSGVDGSPAQAEGEELTQAEGSGLRSLPRAETQSEVSRLPRTGSPHLLAEGPRVWVQINSEHIAIGDEPRVPLSAGERPTELSRDDFREQLRGAVRQAADAIWFNLLEQSRQRIPVASERGIPIALAAERGVSVGLVNDVLAAISAAGQPAELVAAGPGGGLRRVDFADQGERIVWEPSSREPAAATVREDVDGEETVRSPRPLPYRAPSIQLTPEQIAGDAPLPTLDEARAAALGNDPSLPGPNWTDRTVPVRLSVLRRGIWLTAGTVDRRVRGFSPTQVPRDLSHPNVAAEGEWRANASLSSWVDWADLQRRLERLRSRSIAYRLEPVVTVGVSEALPVELLVRTLDVVNLYAPSEALIAGGDEFLAALLGGSAELEFLPRASLAEVIGLQDDEGVGGRRAVEVEGEDADPEP